MDLGEIIMSTSLALMELTEEITTALYDKKKSPKKGI